MKHMVFLPHPSLRDIILHYVNLEFDGNLEVPVEDVMPPNISKGMMFWIHGNEHVFVKTEVLEDYCPDAYLLPQYSTGTRWRFSKPFSMFNVLFKPGKFHMVFPFPTEEFVDGALELDDVREKDLNELKERIISAETHAERVSLLDTYFLKRLSKSGFEITVSSLFIDRIMQTPGTKLKHLSADLPFSSRNLRRVFKREIGLGAKDFQMQARLHKSLEIIHRHEQINLGEIAFLLGYFDPSHFTRDFKKYFGVSPQAYRQQLSALTEISHHRNQSGGNR